MLTNDLAIGVGTTSVSFIGDGANTTVAGGFYKAIMMWVKCLLTVQGTDINSPSYGTGFSKLIGSNIPLSGDVAGSVVMALNDATRQLKAYQTMSPPEERIASVSLQRIEVTGPDSIGVYVLIKNAANQAASVTVPAGG